MRNVLSLVAMLLASAACGSGSPGAAEPTDLPQIVVTTNILGNIVSEAVGDLADVEVIMPIGATPHDFAPSARQAEEMENADLLVVNGAGFEEGMLDVIDNVVESGTPVFAFADAVDLLALGVDGGADPHIWTDPNRIATALAAFAERLQGVDDLDVQAAAASVVAYIDRLDQLVRDIESMLQTVPADRRVLVTDHEVFGYFADRFDFEIAGAIIPSLTTNAEASAAEIDGLAELISAAGIPAVFTDAARSSQLADVLADEVGNDVAVIELYSESLGAPDSDAATYTAMMNTNARLIADALTP